MKKIIILSIIVCSILFFVPEKMYKEIFISICTKIISPPILPRTHFIINGQFL